MIEHRGKVALEVSTDDGKYTVRQTASGAVEIDRYDEPWVTCEHYTKAILTLAQDLEATRVKLQKALSRLPRVIEGTD